MTDTESGDDCGETACESHTSDGEEFRDRLDRLETIVEEQQDVIDAQRERLADMAERDDRRDVAPGGDGTPSTTRRGALTAGGLLALLGLGMGTASANPQGQVGTSGDPLTALYTREVNSGAGGPLTVNVDGNRALLLGGESSGDAGNVVLGHSTNQPESGVVGATIGGGGRSGGGNGVTGNFGTVGGGISNVAGNAESDPTTGRFATVGGGGGNWAKSTGATIPGGINNIAGGDSSFAAGERASAVDANSFVWNDGSDYHDTNSDGLLELSSGQDVDSSGVTGPGTFHVSAQGGVRFITGPSAVTYIPGGSAGWTTTSTRAAKTNIDPVDSEVVLSGVEEMEVATWEYTDVDGEGQGERHIGPMAEEFHEVVDVGSSDEHINSINADGVLFAAVQGLAARLDAETDRLGEELDEKDERIESLESENGALRDRVTDLEGRLPGDDGEPTPVTADD